MGIYFNQKNLRGVKKYFIFSFFLLFTTRKLLRKPYLVFITLIKHIYNFYIKTQCNLFNRSNVDIFVYITNVGYTCKYLILNSV